jgi:hypothetical protein
VVTFFFFFHLFKSGKNSSFCRVLQKPLLLKNILPITDGVQMANSYETFEEKIRRLAAYSKEYETVTLNEIVAVLGLSSNYIIILFLVTPFLQPIPLFGLSTINGFLILLSSVLIIAKRPFFLPKFAKRRTLKGQTLRTICEKLLSIFEITKKGLHRRGRFMSRHILMRWLNGTLIGVLGLLLALPLPLPFTNTLPSVSIATLCLGALKEDGMVIAVGWGFSLITMFYLLTIMFLPFHFMFE